MYKAFIEHFYYDNQFNKLYNTWLKDKNDKYLKPSLDHIIPRSKGGAADISNLQFLTWFENRCKNDMTQAEWVKMKANLGKYLL